MAGHAKSVYLTVCRKDTHQGVFHRKFMNAQALNEYIKTDAFKALYPEDTYYIVKETY
jgi:hypothetical protein